MTMKIKEVEERTGINATTIRYYETEELVIPNRNETNAYREYTEEDIQKLLKIKFYRNLQIPIKVIQDLFNQTITLQEAIKETLIDLKAQKESIALSIDLLEILDKQESTSVDAFTARVFNFYKKHPFIETMDKISDSLSRHLPFLRMGFIPEEPINTKEDLVLELIQYAKREDKKLEILESNMMPEIILNDIAMQVILTPSPVGLGYRIVKYKVHKI